MARLKAGAVWIALAVFILAPLAIAAQSPLLAWRDPIYIGAGLAGVVALSLMVVQPLLVGGYLPDLALRRARRLHAWVGTVLMLAVALHLGGLWITSPPDVIDALLFASPTPFSAWGVVAMIALIGAAVLVSLRRRIPPRTWRYGHRLFVASAVVCTVLHAVLITGTMGIVSKWVLCAAALAATTKVLWDMHRRRRAKNGRHGL